MAVKHCTTLNKSSSPGNLCPIQKSSSIHSFNLFPLLHRMQLIRLIWTLAFSALATALITPNQSPCSFILPLWSFIWSPPPFPPPLPGSCCQKNPSLTGHLVPSPSPSFYRNPTDQPTQNPQWHLMLLSESLSFTQYSTQIFNQTVSDSLWARKYNTRLCC